MQKPITNDELAELLGIDLKSQSIIGFTVRARAGNFLPTVVIHAYLPNLEGKNHKNYILVEAGA